MISVRRSSRIIFDVVFFLSLCHLAAAIGSITSEVIPLKIILSDSTITTGFKCRNSEFVVNILDWKILKCHFELEINSFLDYFSFVRCQNRFRWNLVRSFLCDFRILWNCCFNSTLHSEVKNNSKSKYDLIKDLKYF